MSNQIEIKISGKRLTPDKFLAGIQDFFALVEGVAKNVTSAPVQWSVEVDKGSSIVRMKIENPTREAQQSLDVVSQGIRALRNRISAIPSGFGRNELHAAKRLAKIIDGKEVDSVSIRNGSAPEDFQEAVAETADSILAGQAQTAFGGIEGKIISLSARHGLVCIIYDPIQRREVTCYLQSDSAQQDAVKGFTKRVLASGLIHYTKEGYAVSVTANDIRIFPEESELPTVEEIQKIYQLYK